MLLGGDAVFFWGWGGGGGEAALSVFVVVVVREAGVAVFVHLLQRYTVFLAL
jgi:hypothetical protein